MTIQAKLFLLKDEEYAKFHSKLVPNIPADSIIGIRVPQMRKLEKELRNDEEKPLFLSSLPHKYYDENLLHALMISNMKNYDECITELERFLPFVDNWAVCDTMSPKVFQKHREELICKIIEWSKSDEVYTCRFGIDMLMTHYLDEDFDAKYLDIPAEVALDDYYVKMVVAWYFATALAKQWDSVIPYIEENKLEKWTHNKAIQKASESYRITPEQKAYLKSLKRKD